NDARPRVLEPLTKHRQRLTRLRIVAIPRPRSPTYRLGMRAPCVLGRLDSRRLSHHRHFVRSSQSRPNTIAMPCPPPMQSVTKPSFASRRSISYRILVVITAPVAAI